MTFAFYDPFDDEYEDYNGGYYPFADQSYLEDEDDYRDREEEAHNKQLMEGEE